MQLITHAKMTTFYLYRSVTYTLQIKKKDHLLSFLCYVLINVRNNRVLIHTVLKR